LNEGRIKSAGVGDIEL